MERTSSQARRQLLLFACMVVCCLCGGVWEAKGSQLPKCGGVVTCGHCQSGTGADGTCRASLRVLQTLCCKGCLDIGQLLGRVKPVHMGYQTEGLGLVLLPHFFVAPSVPLVCIGPVCTHAETFSALLVCPACMSCSCVLLYQQPCSSRRSGIRSKQRPASSLGRADSLQHPPHGSSSHQ